MLKKKAKCVHIRFKFSLKCEANHKNTGNLPSIYFLHFNILEKEVPTDQGLPFLFYGPVQSSPIEQLIKVGALVTSSYPGCSQSTSRVLDIT